MKPILIAMAVACATPVWAGNDFSGFHAEIHAGIERPDLNQQSGSSNVVYVDQLSSSFVYGGEVGYDAAVSKRITFGPYISYDRSDSNKCETTTPYNEVVVGCFKSKADLSIGGRAAVALSRKAQVYLGVGYDNYSTGLSGSVTYLDKAFRPIRISKNDDFSGVGISLGANMKLTRHLYAGVGMRISEFGDYYNTGFDLQRIQGHFTLGVRFP